MKNAKILKKELLVDRFKKVVRETLRVSDGKIIEWVYLDSPDSVLIVGVTKDRKLILIKQYRYNLKKYVYELPAGSLDKKRENLKKAAKRELEEETGYTSRNFQYLGKYYVLPSETNRWLHIFLAQDIVRLGEPKHDQIIEKYFDMTIEFRDFKEVAEKIGKKDSIIEGIESCFAILLAKEFLE